MEGMKEDGGEDGGSDGGDEGGDFGDGGDGGRAEEMVDGMVVVEETIFTSISSTSSAISSTPTPQSLLPFHALHHLLQKLFCHPLHHLCHHLIYPFLH